MRTRKRTGKAEDRTALSKSQPQRTTRARNHPPAREALQRGHRGRRIPRRKAEHRVRKALPAATSTARRDRSTSIAQHVLVSSPPPPRVARAGGHAETSAPQQYRNFGRKRQFDPPAHEAAWQSKQQTHACGLSRQAGTERVRKALPFNRSAVMRQIRTPARDASRRLHESAFCSTLTHPGLNKTHFRVTLEKVK